MLIQCRIMKFYPRSFDIHNSLFDIRLSKNALYHLINYFFVLHLIYRIPDADKCPCIGIFFLAFGERIAVGLNNSCKTAETIQGQEANVRAERLHTSPTSPGVHC